MNTPLLKETFGNDHPFILKSLHYPLARELEVMLEQASPANLEWLKMSILRCADRIDTYGDHHLLSSLVVFYPALGEYDEDKLLPPFWNCVDGVRSLPHFSSIDDFFVDATFLQQEQAKAMAYALLHSPKEFLKQVRHYNAQATRTGNIFYSPTQQDEDDYRITFKNPALTELLVERPDKAESIVYAMNSFMTDDAELLRDRVFHSEQSLREGVL